MIGGLSLASTAKSSGGATAVNLNPALGCVGEFLVSMTIGAPTERYATMMVDVTRQGTGISTPENVFRTRHIQRKIWTINDWRTNQSYNAFTNQTTITWSQSSSGMPLQRWGNPFTKPKNYGTASSVISGVGTVGTVYLDESLSTVTGDRYAATSGVLTEPDPIFFTCKLGDGQYLRFEIKYFEDDPFKINPTTPIPTLTDTIPTTTGPSTSEAEVSSSTGSIAVWMLRV